MSLMHAMSCESRVAGMFPRTTPRGSLVASLMRSSLGSTGEVRQFDALYGLYPGKRKAAQQGGGEGAYSETQTATVPASECERLDLHQGPEGPTVRKRTVRTGHSGLISSCACTDTLFCVL